MTLIGFFIAVLLLYLFAILQTSFFIHFALLGAVPNLVFSLFFIFLFFSSSAQIGFKNKIFSIIFAILAGIIMDIYLIVPLGTSAIILIIITLIFRKMQLSLSENESIKSFIFFVPLFLIAMALYNFISQIVSNAFAGNFFSLDFDYNSILSLIVSLVFASVLFFVFKKLEIRKLIS